MSETAPRVVDFDAACTACGYNLRGLEGEHFSCPECGVSWTFRGVLAIRAEVIEDHQARERRLIDARVSRICTGGDLLAIAAGAWGLLAGLWISGFSYFLPIAALGCVAAAVAAMGLCTFAVTTRGLRGRWIALLQHQKFAISAVFLNIGAMVIGVVVVFVACSAAEASPACAVLSIAALPFLIWWTRPFRLFSSQARSALESLVQQRDPGNPDVHL